MISNCIICEYRIGKITSKVVISPWIRKLGVKKRISNYLICSNCDCGFFSYRYNEDEMQCIYEDYRGNHYVRVRNYWEPWYNKKYNSSHDKDSWVAMRVNSLTEFINKFELKPSTVIDIGGDRGQYIPNLGQELSILIDKSGKKPVHGVESKFSLSEIDKSDLIILSHVLEHVANPVETMKELFSYSNVLYIEVPYGVPAVSKKRVSRFRFYIKLFTTGFPMLWRIFSKPATGRKSGTGILVQSEHINFFNEKSIMFLAKILDAEFELEVNEIATPDGNRARVIQCLLFART